MEEKSERILDFIKSYKTVYDGLGPTLQEIADAVGIPKPTVDDHLDRLEELGEIERVPGKAGGIIVIGGSWTCEQVVLSVS